jgi:hypothetical protein
MPAFEQPMDSSRALGHLAWVGIVWAGIAMRRFQSRTRAERSTLS